MMPKVDGIVLSINELIAELEQGQIEARKSKKLENKFHLIFHMISEHHSLLLLDILIL